MPMYDVQGADARTGQDRSIGFEADDDAQAAAVAKARGVMVAKMERRAPPPTVEYAAGQYDPPTVVAPEIPPDVVAALNASTKHDAARHSAFIRKAVVVVKVCAILLFAYFIIDAMGMASRWHAENTGTDLRASGLAVAEYARAGVFAVLLVAVLLVPVPRR